MSATELSALRDAFPSLSRREAGRPAAYFDGPGGTQVPRAVTDAMVDYLHHHNANTGWGYATSVETDRLLLAARSALADFLGCDADEVVFGANMTTLTYHLSRTIGRGLRAGDEVVVTRLDHQANVAPWHDLARDLDLVVREVPFDPATGRLEAGRYDQFLTDRTRVVALGAASNALGTVTPIEPLIAAARAVGAFTFVDAVHSAQHHLPTAHALGCDALACSPYKVHGPHLGALYLRRDALAALDPPRLPCAGDAGGKRMETGTLPHEAIVGAAAAVDFLAGLAGGDGSRRARLQAVYADFERRSEPLFAALWSGLSAIDGVTLYGPPPGPLRTSTVAFTVRGVPPREVTRRLSAEWGVFTSHGDFYASTVIDDLGLAPDGLVRAGIAIYTTDEEVARLVAGVRAVAA